MRCAQAEALLIRGLDEGLPPVQRRRLERHLLRCARCRQETEALQSTAEALRPPPLEDPGEFFWSAFLPRLGAALAAESPEVPLHGSREVGPRTGRARRPPAGVFPLAGHLPVAAVALLALLVRDAPHVGKGWPTAGSGSASMLQAEGAARERGLFALPVVEEELFSLEEGELDEAWSDLLARSRSEGGRGTEEALRGLGAEDLLARVMGLNEAFADLSEAELRGVVAALERVWGRS